jgi:hypothetical protein
MIRGGVAQRVEKAAAAASMAPAFGIHALHVGAHVQKIGPRLIVEFRGIGGPHQMRLTAVGEFEFGPLAAVGTVDEQHALEAQ